MASLPLSLKVKPIRSAKTPQSSPYLRTAVASFTPLGLLSFSASETNAVSGLILITALMSLSVFSISKSNQSDVAFLIEILIRFRLGGKELVGGSVIVSRHLGFTGNFAF